MIEYPPVFCEYLITPSQLPTNHRLEGLNHKSFQFLARFIDIASRQKQKRANYPPDFIMTLAQPMKVDVAHVRFNVVKQALTRAGVIETKNDSDARIVWWDRVIPIEAYARLLSHQRTNRIPNMFMLCYKNQTFRAFNRMKKLFPTHFTFFPETHILPIDFGEFQRSHLKQVALSDKPVTWIYKPRTGCCGNGIRLIQNSLDIGDRAASGIVQRYIEPYLIDGYKFDFRFYVLVAAVLPYTVYVYNEGITRFCTEKYSAPTKENLDDKFGHLTNTSVNVANQEAHNNYLQSAMSVMMQIREKEKVTDLWARIKDAIMLAMVAQHAEIVEQVKDTETARGGLPNFNRYFHIVGVDVMLDHELNPVVLEMNDRPSMAVTFALEDILKTQIIYDTLNLITPDGNPPGPDAKLGGWEQVLPANEKSEYGKQVNAMLTKSLRLRENSLMPRIMSRTAPHTAKTAKRRESCLPPLHQ